MNPYLALGTGLEHLGGEGHHVQQLLGSLLVSFIHQRFQIYVLGHSNHKTKLKVQQKGGGGELIWLNFKQESIS